MRRVSWAVVAAALLLGGCTDIGDLAKNKTKPGGGAGNVETDALSAEFPIAHLKTRTAAANRVGTSTYCSGLDVLDCALVPLVAPEENQCPTEIDKAPVSLRCRPLEGDEALMLGWRVLRRSSGGRALVIHRGDAAKGLAEVFGAEDANGGWSSVHVCTADISDDGRTDVTVEYRTAAAPGQVLVEVVDLSAQPPPAPLVVVKLMRIPDTVAGRGCLTTGLLSADFERRQLDEVTPTSVTASIS